MTLMAFEHTTLLKHWEQFMEHTPTYMTVKRAVKWIEDELGYRPSIPTVYRWILKGVRGQRLASAFMGGVRLIAAADLQAFLLACNERDAAANASPVAHASGARESPRRSPHRERQVRANNEFLRSRLTGSSKASPSSRHAGDHASAARTSNNLASPVLQEERRHHGRDHA